MNNIEVKSRKETLSLNLYAYKMNKKIEKMEKRISVNEIFNIWHAACTSSSVNLNIGDEIEFFKQMPT